MIDLASIPTIETIDLEHVCGGDGWSDYKGRLAQDVQDTKSRFNQAVKYNAVNGNWNFGKWADNTAGTIFNGGKTVVDAAGGLFGLLK